MTAYRFCRTDDMGLLVEAYEKCRGPEDADAPALDRARFKELVRELDLWCSSCMLALEGREPVGVLLGAKRAEATLVYGVRVHPAHRRRGHGRHLLTSLGQKLAILGPARLVAEVPAERAAARHLFAACGWVVEARLLDWRREGSPAAETRAPAPEAVAPIALSELLSGGGLLPGDDTVRCWQRALPSLLKLEDKLLGLAFHSAERLEAWLLYRNAPAWEVFAAGFAAGALGRQALNVLVQELVRAATGGPLLFGRVAPEEAAPELLAELGFRSGREHLLFVTQARAA